MLNDQQSLSISAIASYFSGDIWRVISTKKANDDCGHQT
jgi:hypothetical protein